MTLSANLPLPTKPDLLWRGVRSRCPNCGIGSLFKSYLKQVDHCSNCGENFSQFRADDGPAWVTILLTGHIVVPVTMYMGQHVPDPGWGVLAGLIGLTVFLVFALIQPAKGAFIAVLWYLAKKRQKENDKRLELKPETHI